MDLDIIELSNLNRQLLFRKQHIGQPKAKIASAAVHRLSPEAQITAHCADIKDTHLFPISFFRGFTIILNALDNLDARRYVNNMALSVGVPLVESGTAGYLGQTMVIFPGETECFDCTPKEKPKTFPVCTIRTTPSAPIHCIVWAKEVLLSSLFGPKEALSEEFERDEDGKLVIWHLIADRGLVERLIASLRKENASYLKLRESAAKAESDYSQQIFDKVFNKDIQRSCELEELWEGKELPEPLSINLLEMAEMSVDQHSSLTLPHWISLFKTS